MVPLKTELFSKYFDKKSKSRKTILQNKHSTVEPNTKEAKSTVKLKQEGRAENTKTQNDNLSHYK